MANFVVGYQLNKQKDYPELWDELKRLDGHKAMNSFWLVDVNVPDANRLMRHLTTYVDQDDMLFVSEITEKPAAKKCYQGTQAWIDARF
jgi:hypothetical protein